MQLRFFAIPVGDGTHAEAELNAFLRSQRVLSVEKHFVTTTTSAYWAVAVEFLGENARRPASPGGPRVDYKDVLSAEDFAVYRRLRDLRKQIADTDGVPAFAVFTNAQLAAMVTERALTASALGKIDGIGEAKLGKYGARMLTVLKEAFGEESGSCTTRS